MGDGARFYWKHLPERPLSVLRHPFDAQDRATLHRLFEVDGCRSEMIWAMDTAGAISGVAHRMGLSPREVEIGLIVCSDAKRVGIGETSLKEILARSVRRQIRTVRAYVLHENRAALQLVTKLGLVPRALPGTGLSLTVELICELRGRSIEKAS